MAELSEYQIDFVSEEIKSRGVNLDSLHNDLLDHICTSIERKMDEGLGFDSAFVQSIKLFGPNGLMQVQHQTLLILTQMNETMKKLSLGFGLATTALLLAGILFKAMHWPGAAIMLVLGNFSLVCGYIPVLLIQKLKEGNGKDKYLSVAGFVGLAVFATGITFKIMHWPTANILFWSGFLVISLGYLPLYFYLRIKESVNKSVTITSAIITFVCVVLLLEMMNFRSSYQYTHGITLINQSLESSVVLAKENLGLQPEGELATEANALNATADLLVNYIEDLKTELKARTQGISTEEAAKATLMDLSRKNDHTECTTLMLQLGKADELAQKIEAYEKEVVSIFPENQQSAIAGIIDFETTKVFEDHYERNAPWAEYYFRDIALIGVVSNLSSMQLKVRNAQNLALVHLKTQSEAQQPPSAEF
jgi:hypothetical protein